MSFPLRRFVPALLSLAVLSSPSAPLAAAGVRQPDPAAKPSLAPRPAFTFDETFGKLPLAFEQNRGQFDPAVRFVGRGPGYTVGVYDDHVVMLLPKQAQPQVRLRILEPFVPAPATLRGSSRAGLGFGQGAWEPLAPPPLAERIPITMRFDGGRPARSFTSSQPLPGKMNYFKGNDPARWVTKVPTSRRVTANGVYPGIDVAFYGNPHQLEYDFVVEPGVDPGVIRMAFEGHQGLELQANGDLRLKTEAGPFTVKRPHVYEEIAGVRTPLESGFRLLADGRVGFRVESRRREARLVIDPVLQFWRGFGDISFCGVAIDSDGNILAGGSASASFQPTPGSFQTQFGGGESDMAVAKVAPSGDLIFASFLGGTGGDIAGDLDVDGAGRPVIAGTTGSADFPGAPDPDGGGNVVAKLLADGTGLVFSQIDLSTPGVVVQRPPTAVATKGDTTYVAGEDYAIVLSATGEVASGLQVGGSLELRDLAVDKDSGVVWLAGIGQRFDMPLVDPIAMPPASEYDYQGFILKYDQQLTQLLAGTSFGGSDLDLVQSIAVDVLGRPVCLGMTFSADFPIVGGLGFQSSGLLEPVLFRLTASGKAVEFSTRLSLQAPTSGFGTGQVATDALSNIYATFELGDPQPAFPSVDPISPFLDITFSSSVMVVSASGSTLLFSSGLGFFFSPIFYLDPPVRLAVSPSGDIFLASAGFDMFGDTVVGALGRIVQGAAAASLSASLDNSVVMYAVGNAILTASITHAGPSVSELSLLDIKGTSGVIIRPEQFTGPSNSVCRSFGNDHSFCGVAGMAAGETATLTLPVRGGVPGTYSLDLQAIPSGTDPDPADNTVHLEFTVVTGEADLSIAGTSLPSPPLVGQTLTYSLAVNNAGPDEAQQTTLTGTLPANVLRETITPSAGTCAFTPTGFTCNLGTVAAGAAPTVDVVVRPLQAGPVSSTFSVTGLALDNNLANNELTLADNAVSSGVADVSVALADAPDPLTVGGTITYTTTVSNAGPDAAPNATVVVTLDPSLIQGVPIPSQGGCAGTGPFTCSLGTIGSGATATVMVSGATTGPAEALAASALVYSDASDESQGNNAASATTRVALPGADVKVEVVRTPATVLTDEEVIFTITVTNLGLDLASGVQVVSTLSGDDITLLVADTTQGACTFTNPVTCTLGDMAFGGVATISVVARKATAGTLTNDVAATSATNDPVAGNNAASASATVNQRVADVSVVTTVAPPSAFTGGTATYTITVTNAGPQDATQVQLTFDLDSLQSFLSTSAPPTECNGGSTTTCSYAVLGPGESKVVTVTAALLSAGAAKGTSGVAAAEFDPNFTNNGSFATLQVVESADLVVTNVDAPDPVDAGSNITYTVKVRNDGPTAATDVALTSVLDASTTFVSATPSLGTCAGGPTVECALGTIAAGATVTVDVKAKTTLPGTVTSTATASSPVPDPAPASNTATATTTVRPVADLSITASDEVDPILVGGSVAYQTSVTNLGPFDATNAGLRLELPPGAAVVSLSPTPPTTCTLSGGAVTCAIGPLAVGASASARIALSASLPGVLTSLIRTTSANTDPVSSNNVAAVRTSVDAPGGDLSILKTHTPGNFTLGGTGRFTFTIRRLSGQAVTTPLQLGSVANSRFGTDLTLDGSRMTSTRAKLLSASSFGAGGTSTRPIAITDVSATLSPEVLAVFDAFFIGYLNDDNARKLSASELAAFTAFVNDGGTLIATCDDFNYDAVCNAFGYFVLSTLPPTVPITPTADGQTHPIFHGPFGAVAQYSGFQTVGYFASPAPGVSILARAPDGKPLLMTRRFGQGQVIFMSDVDHIAGALTSGSGITSDNDRLLGNLVVYAGRTGTPVVTDRLPAGLTFASAAGASCLADGPLVTCSLAPVATGTATTFTIDVNVGAGAYARTANVGNLATPGDTNAANNAYTDLVDVIGGVAVPKGDLDLNGTVDVFDLVILANYLVGNYQDGTPPFVATAATADLNNDGRIDVFDLVLLASCIVAGGGC